MYIRLNRNVMALFIAAVVALAVVNPAAAQPGSPAYTTRWSDCDTSDNRFVGGDGIFHWDVDANCDIYQRDQYERPMTQTFYSTRGRYGAVEYFEYLDITQASAGFDAQFLYVQLDLAGRNHLTSDGTVIRLGMVERYGFRMSTDPEGRYGVLIVADQPEFKNEPNTVFGPIGTFGYRDTDGDVGGADRDGPTGLTVTKSDNPDEEDGTLNGYDAAIISDGRLDDETPVLWVRLNPSDSTQVEFALDYQALGFTQNELSRLGYFHVEASKGGPKDPQNYLWNDKYTKTEAGSPNPGSDGESEFGTEGLQNIYEVDTATGGAIGEDGAFIPGNDVGVVPVDQSAGSLDDDGFGDDDGAGFEDGGFGVDDSGFTADGIGDFDDDFCGAGVVGMIPLLTVGWLSLRGRGCRKLGF